MRLLQPARFNIQWQRCPQRMVAQAKACGSLEDAHPVERRTRNTAGLTYGLDDRPPFGQATVLGLQHVLTMFGSTVAVPLIFGPKLWPVVDGIPTEVAEQLRDLQLTNTALLISSVMLCSGVATFLQSTFGSRLPIIQGVSFSFLAAFLGIVASTQAVGAPDWAPVIAGATDAATLDPLILQWQEAGAFGMRTIAGAILVGGIAEAVIGFTGLIGRIRRYLSPVVIGPVIMLIGLALYQVGAPVAASNWYISITTMVLIILFALVLSRSIRLFKLFPMLLAILGSVAVCVVLGAAGVFRPCEPAHVDVSAVGRSDWVRVKSLILPWGLPSLSLGAVVAVLAGYLASTSASIASSPSRVQAHARTTPRPTP